ncbi:MAG: radical SAM protein [Nitrososphaeria archaeon]
MKIILTCDKTLTGTYRDIPLLDFLPCAPSEKVPSFIYNILDTQLAHENGILKVAPYSLRKVEASLLAHRNANDTVVVHSSYVQDFISEETEIVGVSTMDPLGLGPVSMMFTFGGLLTSYSKKSFIELIKKLDHIRVKNGYRYKIVVGGPGSWQLVITEKWKELNIDHVVVGETDHVINDLFNEIVYSKLPEVVYVKSFPKVEEISVIVNPSYKGMVEVMRGCGRNCKFCEPNLRFVRFIPIEKIIAEAGVNLRYGIGHCWLHSEDIFLYMLEDHKNFYPNSDEVVNLFRRVMSLKGMVYANPTHGSIAPVVATPSMVEQISEVVNACPDKWVGIQIGLETASSTLMRKYMANKVKPFSVEEWPKVILEGTYILNKNFWFPAYTTMVGLPGESREDSLETAGLILAMERFLSERLGSRAHFTVTPLAFIPLGVLRNEKFFNIADSLTEERFLLIYTAWKHIAKELNSSLPMVLKNNPVGRILFPPIAKFGIWELLRAIRSWGVNQGYDPDKPIKPLEDIKLKT